MRRYCADLWARRPFMTHLATTDLHQQHADTALGQLWIILNPLLLALVYYVLVAILKGSARGRADFFSHLVIGIFTFTFVRTCVLKGARAVVSSGDLLLNVSFPRLVLPLGAVLTGILSFLPTVVVAAVVHLALRQPFYLTMLLLPVVLLHLFVFASGLAMLASMVTVYFRDMTNILPYLMRIWLYLTPVIYAYDEIPDSIAPYLKFNPLYWNFVMLQKVTAGRVPSAAEFLLATTLAVAVFVLGAYAFVRQEQDYALRL